MGADALIILTDVDGVFRDHGTPDAEMIRSTTPTALRAIQFPTGSMGPKIDAVCRFVERTRGFAAIGSLADAAAVLTGERGTLVRPD
jgi:carbamate kinase